MTAEAPSDEVRSGTRAPDSRALPSGTTLRFGVLLLVMVVASVGALDRALQGWFGSAGSEDCWIAAGFDPKGDPHRNFQVQMDALDRPGCFYADDGLFLYWRGVTGTAVVLLVAFAVYWWLPWWRRRSSRLKKLAPGAEDDGIRAELAGLVEDARVRPAPDFMVFASPGTGASVFGRPGRRTVRLDAGLLAVRDSGSGRFKAVVLHELAHLKNRDVDIAYAVVALWRAYLGLVVAPYLLLYFVPSLIAAPQYVGFSEAMQALSLPGLARDLATSVLLLLLVPLAKSDALRHRELYADATAVALGADRGVWESEAARTPARRGAGTVRALLAPWRAHPSWRQRELALGDPAALFSLGAAQMFLIGCAALVTANALTRFWDGLLMVRLISVPVALIVTFAVWRALLYTKDNGGRKQPGGLRSGLWLGVGLTVGELISGLGPLGQWVPERWELSLVLVPAAVAYTAWIALCGRLQLRFNGRPRVLIWPSALAAVLLAVVALSWWTQSGSFYVAGEDQWLREQFTRALAVDSPTTWVSRDGQLAVLATMTLLLLDLAFHKTSLIMALVLWALPLLLWVWQTGGRRGSGLAGTLAAGLVGGAVTAAGLLGLLAYLRSWHQPLALRDTGFDVAFGLGARGVVWLGTLMTALAVVILVRHERLLRAVVAAAVAQTVAVAAGFLVSATWGCLGPLSITAAPCAWKPGAAWAWTAPLAKSALPAVFGALLVAAVVLGAMHLAGVRDRPVTAAPEPAPDPDLTAQRSKPVLYRAATVTGSVLLVLAAVIVGERAFSAPGTPPVARHVPVPAPVPPKESTDPHVRARQALAWLRETKGTNLAVLSDYGAYGKERQAMLRTARSPAPPAPAEAVRFRGVCTALAADALRAQRGVPYPDPVVQRTWSSALHTTRQAAAACLAWLPPGGMHSSGARAVARLDDGLDATTKAMEPIMARLADAKRYWPEEFQQ
ncbi:M48 family metalloprotease [Streptomyces sp. NPDC021093]|uniref:M48 family metalloprotease n=1 Tax=Streptomyces sp. NPDC021093 TaxID=3365112 RepID=UPI003788E356